MEDDQELDHGFEIQVTQSSSTSEGGLCVFSELFQPVLTAKEYVGLSCVAKEGGKQRLIVSNACSTRHSAHNQRKTEAQRTYTYSSATVASCDVENCFRRLRVDYSLSQWFTSSVEERSGTGRRRLDSRRTHSLAWGPNAGRMQVSAYGFFSESLFRSSDQRVQSGGDQPAERRNTFQRFTAWR